MYGLEDLYRFLCPLGRGAEGEVYLVEDLYRGGTLCALKILPGRGGLPLEFRRLARLRHRALARVLDSGTVPAAGRGYFTSEYFPGRSILSLPAPFSWPFFEGLLREACSALACLNDAGLRHGDLKSAHILYSPPPQPLLRIIDLGHAARLDDARPLSAGTLPYAAPELWGGPGAPGRSTDLYALGMTCVELISGSWPVPAGDREEWRQWHLQGDREMVLREATLTPPPHLLSLIRGLIEPDPADRPRDAEELLPHLRRWEGVAVPPPPPPPLVGRDAMLRELLDWLAAPGGEGAEARILTGPAGVGKSRLLASLLRLAQGAGIAADHLNGAILAQEGTALRTRLEHTLGSGDQGRALLIDDLDPGAGAGGLPFPRWWRRLRESLSRPWPRLVAVLQGTGDAQAAQGLVEALQTDGIPAEQLHLPPLNRDETVQLLEHVGRGEPPTAQEEEAAWRQSLGYPGKIIHLCGAEASERPRARPLDPHLEALLRALPAPVPLEALLAALAWPAERLWAELAAAGDTAPPVAGVAPELRVHPLPRSSARGSPPVPREILLGLAEEWRRLGGIDADWGPELIERIAGREPAPGSLALLRLRLREDRRWGPLEAVAELMLEDVSQHLAERGLEVRAVPEVFRWLVDRTCKDREYGARPLRR
ncbi:MAG: AAA family ATPase, partial [Planctomycetota bacterium]